jgi:hypothetical protein
MRKCRCGYGMVFLVLAMAMMLAAPTMSMAAATSTPTLATTTPAASDNTVYPDQNLPAKMQTDPGVGQSYGLIIEPADKCFGNSPALTTARTPLGQSALISNHDASPATEPMLPATTVTRPSTAAMMVNGLVFHPCGYNHLSLTG